MGVVLEFRMQVEDILPFACPQAADGVDVEIAIPTVSIEDAVARAIPLPTVVRKRRRETRSDLSNADSIILIPSSFRHL